MKEVKEKMISVVIPIYNVGQYLCRCIESVIRQSFEDLEILLINDGSTDTSGATADWYANQDPRVRVVHKANGGLSDARNVGMKMAKGEYLFFLDSDDWLTQDALQILMEHMIKEQADLVVGDFYYMEDTALWRDERYLEKGKGITVLNNTQAMEKLVNNKVIKNFAWGKLYKTEKVRDIFFEKGKLFEDIFWQHQVFARIHRCVVVHEPIMYYYQRPDSIVARFRIKKLDCLEGMYERYLFIQREYPYLEGEARYMLLKMCMEYLVALFIHRKKVGTNRYSKAIKSYISLEYEAFRICSRQDKILSTQLKLLRVHMSLVIAYMGLKKIMRSIGICQSPQGLTKIERVKD